MGVSWVEEPQRQSLVPELGAIAAIAALALATLVPTLTADADVSAPDELAPAVSCEAQNFGNPSCIARSD